MNEVYFDGTYHYKVINDNGQFKKVQVDQFGNPMLGGATISYSNKEEMDKDINNMFEVVPNQNVSIKPAGSNEEFYQINQPKVESKPNFIQKISQGISNLLKDNNPYKDTYYADEQKRIGWGQDELKQMRAQNRAQAKELRLKQKEFNTENKLYNAAERGRALGATAPEKSELMQIKSQNKKMKSMIKAQDKIDRQRNRLQKMINKAEIKQAELSTNPAVSESMVPEFKEGGIYIKPSKRGTFTAAANKRGLGVQEFANKVMSNKDNYSSSMVKKANFARNAAKWKHQTGGLIPFGQGVGEKWVQPYLPQPERKNLVGSYYDEKDELRDPYGNLVIQPQLQPVQKDSKVTPKTSTTSNNNVNEQNYNPYKLSAYGDRIAEGALNRTTGFNLSRFIGDRGRVNPIITSQYEPKRQYAQAQMQPIHEQFYAGQKGIERNLRGSAGLVGNLLQHNANKVRAMQQEATRAQLQQKGYDTAYEQQQAQKAAELAQAQRQKESLDRADYAAKQQFLSDTMTQWERGDQQRARLYNAQLQNINNLNTYVNQLSPEYKAVMDKDGVVKVVFKSTGQEVPQAEFDKKQAQYKVSKEKGTEVKMNGGYTVDKKKRIRRKLY